MPIRQIPASDYHHVLNLLEASFPDVSRTFFHSVTHFDPWYDERFSLGVDMGGKPVSFLQIFDRTVLLNHQPVRIGGIGGVGTHPNHEGKGYATKLLRHAQEVMQRENMTGSILFTKINPFYERLGWKTLPLQEQEIAVSEVSSLKNPHCSSQPVKESDYETLHELYQLEQHNYHGTLIRTISYWKNRVRWMNHTCRVIRNRDEVVAYLYGAKYRKDIPTLQLTEFGLKDHDPDTVSAWLEAAVQLAQENRCCTLRSNFTVHPAVQQFITDNQIPVHEKPYHYIMWWDCDSSCLSKEINRLIKANQFIYWQTDAF